MDEVPFDIPDSWEWVRLSQIALVLNGDRGKNYPSKEKLVSSGIPFISALNLDGRTVVKDGNLLCVTEEQYNLLANGKLKEGDIVVCIRGSLGKHAKYPFEKGAIASSLVILRTLSNEETLSDYIMMWLDSPLFFSEIRKYDNGTAQPNLAAKSLEQFFVPIPPLGEQRRIVEKINEVTSAVSAYDVAYQRNETLNSAFPESLKKSILQEAVQGKLVSQDPSDEPAEALLERIRAEKQRLIKEGKIKKEKHESIIFRRDNSHYEKLDGVESCIDDEIPFEIPDTWAWSRLGSLVEVITSGSRDWAKHYSEKGSLFLRMGNLSRNSFELRLNSLKRVQLPEKAEGTRTALQAGDLLFSITGEVGMLGLIPDDFETAYINQHTAMIRFLPLIRNKYLPYFLLTDYAQKCYKSNQHGIKNSFRLDSISNILVPIPPLSEQEQIIRRIEQATNRIATM